MASKKVLFLMADYGHDPTETAVVYVKFREAGFEITISTEKGKTPECDKRMLQGMTGKLLGANKLALECHQKMLDSEPFTTNQAVAWSSVDVTTYDAVFLPGGHDKGVRQVIDSPEVHGLLAIFKPLTKRDHPSGRVLGAVCHGVQVLATAPEAEGSEKMVIHDLETTALTSVMENSAYWATRLFLGDYYKTYGAGTPNVEEFVRLLFLS